MNCPYCKHEIDYRDLHRDFMSGVWDYQTNFTMECPLCELTLEVEVESIPEFTFHKPAERVT